MPWEIRWTCHEFINLILCLEEPWLWLHSLLFWKHRTLILRLILNIRTTLSSCLNRKVTAYPAGNTAGSRNHGGASFLVVLLSTTAFISNRFFRALAMGTSKEGQRPGLIHSASNHRRHRDVEEVPCRILLWIWGKRLHYWETPVSIRVQTIELLTSQSTAVLI